MVQLTLAPVVNENLFTKHYLEERVRDIPEWQEEDEIKDSFEEIKEIYERKKSILSSCNESQLREEFINPVLRVLDFHLGVEAPVQHSAKQPDYALFESESDKLEAYQKDESEDFYQKSVAVADAKAWGVDFDKKSGRENVFENRNPSFQIYYYLDSTPPGWGFLTNGRKWRLYYDGVGLSQWFDTYYEVDLIDILENENLEDFKYFYLFFRENAFTPIGNSFLDQAYRGSEKYAQEIGENLEKSVYEALLWMAKGYLDMGTNNLEKTKENVKKVHDNSLIFLYRLLFLLYAESNGMLGTEMPQKYERQWSFSKWIDDILRDIDNDQVDPKGGLYHFRLKSIFRLVREGSEGIEDISSDEFYVPAYNGGLFSQEKYPFLNQKKIQNGHLARIINLLVRASSAGDGKRGRIDYSDLSLRHLGGIYEGLLEYKLKLTDQDMVAEKRRGTLKWILASESKKDFSEFDEDKRAREGELYLVTDKGERKATGSYYTPDYIVKYIVENSVGPIIEEKLENTETDQEKRNAILSTKVLDPAMGSGHFLVETIDFLASRLVEFVENGGKKRDIDWAKRKVARNCIYGVDVNPLATELAKVSLWLNTMAEDKPLSFLDHHLKTGNSLIGADIHKLDKHPEGSDEETGEKNGQLALSDFFGKSVRGEIKQLLGVYREMLEITEERPEDIKEQEKLFAKFEEHPFKNKFDVLADVKTSYYFGNEFSKSKYEKLLDAFRSEDEDWEKITKEEWIKKASDSVPNSLEENLSDKKRFFHWKLEFPEVFFDIKEGREKDNPGFDTVIGNPPYISFGLGRTGKLSKSEENFYRKKFDQSAEYKISIYALFMDLCIEKCREKGYSSLIVPDSFLTGRYFSKIRKLILQNTKLEYLILFEKDFWQSGDVGFPTIYVIKKKSLENLTKQPSFSFARVKNLNEILNVNDYLDINQKSQIKNPRMRISLQDKETRNIIDKLDNLGDKLEEYISLHHGIRSRIGRDEIISDEKEGPSWKKAIVSSGEIRKFYKDPEEHYIHIDPDILFGGGWDSNKIERNKILMRRTGDSLICAVDNEGYYHTNALIYGIPKKEDKDLSLSVLCLILNSKLIKFYYQNTTMKEGRTLPQVEIDTVENIPICNFSPDSNPPNSKPRELYEKYISESSFKEIIGPSEKEIDKDHIPFNFKDFLEILVKKIRAAKKERFSLNTNLLDYLGNYNEGKTIEELYTPASGLSETVLTDTKADRENLKLGSINFEEDNGELILKASAKYKPKDKEEFEDLDRWGYTETEFVQAMKFSGSEKELSLIQEFTKLAVDEAGGFAGFRKKATKSTSLIDRLEKLTLPKLEDVESGLKKYLEQKKKAEKLEKEIQETDNLIDAIVFKLYDLTEKEVEVVLDSLDTEDEVKENILEKFREVND